MRRLRIHAGAYTLKESVDGRECPIAGPPRYSPDDKYARFRLVKKREEWGI